MHRIEWHRRPGVGAILYDWIGPKNNYGKPQVLLQLYALGSYSLSQPDMVTWPLALAPVSSRRSSSVVAASDRLHSLDNTLEGLDSVEKR